MDVVAALNSRIADLTIRVADNPGDRKAEIELALAVKDKENWGEKLLAGHSSQVSVAKKLQELGVKYSTMDLNYLFKYDKQSYGYLKLPGLTVSEAESILLSARSKIKSRTKLNIGSLHSFFVGKPLQVKEGQGRTSFYYGYTEMGKIVVAKVYKESDKEVFDRDVRVNQLFQHKNIVKNIKWFHVEEKKFYIIVMPLYPESVADAMTVYSEMPVSIIRCIARDCFSALCHVHSNGYIFGDLKPSNIMLNNTDDVTATLIDLGAVVKIGEPVVEYSQEYCLDVNTAIATEKIDWACFGSTIANMSGVDIFLYNSRSLLIDACERRDMNDDIRRLIRTCFKSPYLKDIQVIIEQLE